MAKGRPARPCFVEESLCLTGPPRRPARGFLGVPGARRAPLPGARVWPGHAALQR